MISGCGTIVGRSDNYDDYATPYYMSTRAATNFLSDDLLAGGGGVSYNFGVVVSSVILTVWVGAISGTIVGLPIDVGVDTLAIPYDVFQQMKLNEDASFWESVLKEKKYNLAPAEYEKTISTGVKKNLARKQILGLAKVETFDEGFLILIHKYFSKNYAESICYIDQIVLASENCTPGLFKQIFMDMSYNFKRDSDQFFNHRFISEELIVDKIQTQKVSQYFTKKVFDSKFITEELIRLIIKNQEVSYSFLDELFASEFNSAEMTKFVVSNLKVSRGSYPRKLTSTLFGASPIPINSSASDFKKIKFENRFMTQSLINEFCLRIAKEEITNYDDAKALITLLKKSSLSKENRKTCIDYTLRSKNQWKKKFYMMTCFSIFGENGDGELLLKNFSSLQAKDWQGYNFNDTWDLFFKSQKVSDEVKGELAAKTIKNLITLRNAKTYLKYLPIENLVELYKYLLSTKGANKDFLWSGENMTPEIEEIIMQGMRAGTISETSFVRFLKKKQNVKEAMNWTLTTLISQPKFKTTFDEDEYSIRYLKYMVNFMDFALNPLISKQELNAFTDSLLDQLDTARKVAVVSFFLWAILPDDGFSRELNRSERLARASKYSEQRSLFLLKWISLIRKENLYSRNNALFRMNWIRSKEGFSTYTDESLYELGKLLSDIHNGELKKEDRRYETQLNLVIPWGFPNKYLTGGLTVREIKDSKLD